MKSSLIITGFFLAGLLGGLFFLFPEWMSHPRFSSYALYALMFFVGIGMGSNRRIFQVFKTLKGRILLVPLSAITGTLIGVALVSFVMPRLNIKECLAVGAGFGYYSLSSVILSQLHSDTLGAIALLSNISREVATLLLAPALARYFGKIAPVASGGATAMDTTLPIIIHSSGKAYGMIAVFSGTVLTLLIPFLVSFLINL